jgi:hypothetical protein
MTAGSHMQKMVGKRAKKVVRWAWASARWRRVTRMLLANSMSTADGSFPSFCDWVRMMATLRISFTWLRSAHCSNADDRLSSSPWRMTMSNSSVSPWNDPRSWSATRFIPPIRLCPASRAMANRSANTGSPRSISSARVRARPLTITRGTANPIIASSTPTTSTTGIWARSTSRAVATAATSGTSTSTARTAWNSSRADGR